MGEKKKFRFKLRQHNAVSNVMVENEIKANKATAITMINCVVTLLVIIILALTGVFKINGFAMHWLWLVELEFLFPAVLCLIRKGKGRAIKYLLVGGLMLGITLIYILIGGAVLVALLIPLIISCRYYSKVFVGLTAVFTSIMLFVAEICGVLYGSLDLNAVLLKEKSTMTFGGGITMESAILGTGVTTGDMIGQMLKYSVVPNLLIFTVIFVICYLSALRGLQMANEEANIIEKSSRIESELSLATDIQANMLPNIFPAFPEHDEFDVYATMNPAKEVGGDFYDYFMIDDTHVAMVIADVSGKGVPAALFMVTAKTLIKDHTQLGLAPAEVFTRVNRILCEGNEAGLFVTGWMGIADLNTGKLTYVNAGHNPPLLRRDNGTFEYLKSRAGFVLAGMDTIKYKQAELMLKPGDRLFLYTDGVTEATSVDKELYGEDRLRDYLNAHPDTPNREELYGIRADIDEFVGEAEQFDDITMLIFDLKKVLNENITEEIFPAEIGKLDEVTAFVCGELEKAEAPMKVSMQISVALEEMFVNVAHYAYQGRAGYCKIAVSIENNTMTLHIKDTGMPFNPLEHDDPDITLSAEEREIGGLGILMVKKTMDDVRYQYKDGMNILTMVKKW